MLVERILIKGSNFNLERGDVKQKSTGINKFAWERIVRSYFIRRLYKSYSLRGQFVHLYIFNFHRFYNLYYLTKQYKLFINDSVFLKNTII